MATCRDNCIHYDVCDFVSFTGTSQEKDCKQFKDKDSFAELKNMKWRPHYYIFNATGEKMRDGWHCSVCGKHSYSRKEICDGCNTVMWKVEVR